MGWLSTKGRILEPSTSRMAFFLVGASAFVMTEFGRFVVRPWVRSIGVNDFGLTDTIGNWGGILVQIFLGCAVINPTRQQSCRLAAVWCRVEKGTAIGSSRRLRRAGSEHLTPRR